MSEAAARALAHAVARVVVNHVARDGERWVKRRLPRSTMVIAPGNVYLKRAGQFRMLASAEAWAQREVAVHRALYGDAHAGFHHDHAIWVEHVPGSALTELVETDSPLLPRALVAAGKELRRAHATLVHDAFFSHGDLHLSNILFCADQERAQILDFETQHADGAEPATRHADDLICLALDFAGKSTSPDRAVAHWRALLAGYGGADDVLRGVAAGLVVADRLLPRSLQLIRTRNMPKPQLVEVLARMQRVVLDFASDASSQ